MIDALQNSTACNIQLFSINTKKSKQLIDQISVISPNSSSDINATVELPKKNQSARRQRQHRIRIL
jgi:hypothetical protein